LVMRQNLPIDIGDIATITLSMLAEWNWRKKRQAPSVWGKTDKGHMSAP
jgi:hypothetical protein